jgi:nitrite reductase/ring-hydroxylating ferredoxin subunit
MRAPGVKPPEPGKAVRILVENTAIAVFNVGGQLYAIDAKCTHVGGPLDQGPVHATVVTCPWHGSQFDVRTGTVVQGPAARPVKSYRVQVSGDGLSLEPA